MADDTKINPLGWGILFFMFWVSLVTIPGIKAQTLSWDMAWVSFGLSILMLISIEPHIRNWLNKPGVIRYIVMLVFYISLMSYAVAYISSVGAVDATIRPILIIFGFIWLLVYLCILSSRSPRPWGIVVSILFIGIGVYNFLAQQTDIGRVSLISCAIVAVITLVCSLMKPKFISEIPLI
jgi:hypothetical protein